MYLFEFDQNSADITKIVALANQLKDGADSGEIDPDNYTVEELLNYFQDYDVILDKSDLYNMIKTDPLKSVISNINDDKIEFKGHEKAPEPEQKTDEKPEDENKKTVAKMAKSAMKI